MFKDTNEGQTHSYNDGCGELAHNDTWVVEVLNRYAHDFRGIAMTEEELYKMLQNFIKEYDASFP